jgi:hypothetical protein
MLPRGTAAEHPHVDCTTGVQSEGTADPIGLAARQVQSCCGCLSLLRRQMLVRMNPAMAELDALDRTADTDGALESTWW